jgi:tetratricopeptide (TPR) repeat protein
MGTMRDPNARPTSRWWTPVVLGGLCAGVIAVYAALGWSRVSEMGNPTPRGAYYNLLVDAFRAGQLHLPREVPAGLAALPDPYDPEANGDFRGAIYVDTDRLHDLSYYRGRLYLYFGVTPALLLFWPYAALTGHYLEHAQAVTIFVSVGFLAGTWLLWSAWRRYFSQTPALAVIAVMAAFGLASGIPAMLSRPDVWEVPITCGYALVMLTLVALWRAVHEARHRAWALAAASLAYGLAVGARPSLLFGAVILLVPVYLAWARRRDPASPAGDWRRLLPAALIPIGGIGLGLAYYNYLRFGTPTEFGQTFQLAGERQDINHFGLGYLGFNLRAYFWAWGDWSTGFPYFQQPDLPPMPPGHGGVERPFALLTNSPLAWLALAVPLAWRARADADGRNLRAFLAAVAVLFFSATLVLGLFYGTCQRYEIEFAPALFLLAAFGALALDRALDGRPALRRFSRAGSVVLLVASLAGNLLTAVAYRGLLDHDRGFILLAHQRSAESLPALESAVRLQPFRTKARLDLASAYVISGQTAPASAQLAEALRRAPALAPEIYEGYGPVFLAYQRQEDVFTILQAALALQPGSARFHHDAGVILARLGRDDEAVPHLQEALRLAPDVPTPLITLGQLAQKARRFSEARGYFERALRADPNNASVRELLQRLESTAPPPFLQR